MGKNDTLYRRENGRFVPVRARVREPKKVAKLPMPGGTLKY
jgi:hypothetical protein